MNVFRSTERETKRDVRCFREIDSCPLKVRISLKKNMRTLKKKLKQLHCLRNNVFHGNPPPSFLGVITPYLGGSKPSFFMVLGSKGSAFVEDVSVDEFLQCFFW